MRYKRYEKYKDSGVEWIGEVPEHWVVQNLGYKSRMIVPMRDKPTEFNGDIPWVRIEDVDGQYIDDSKSEQRVSMDLIKSMNLKVYPVGTVLCTCSCSMGSTVIVKRPLVSNQTFIGIVPQKDLDTVYLYYLLNSNSERLQFISAGAIQQYLSRYDFEHLKLAFPPYKEQEKIANFLDQKTSEIDSLIADKEKLIELLLEQRQAIISEAVTKGLDRNIKMKDSGIEWIGEVPEHWEVKRIKHIAFLKSGEGITSELINDEGKYPVYGGNGLRGYTASFTHNGDYILIGRQGALCGNINYAHGKFWASEHAVVVLPVVTIETLWLGELLRIMNLNQYSISAAQPGLAVDKIKNLFLPFPPYQEQKVIADYIGQKISDIDFLIQQIKTQIISIFEYRKSLISEVVTGKIML